VLLAKEVRPLPDHPTKLVVINNNKLPLPPTLPLLLPPLIKPQQQSHNTPPTAKLRHLINRNNSLLTLPQNNNSRPTPSRGTALVAMLVDLPTPRDTVGPLLPPEEAIMVNNSNKATPNPSPSPTPTTPSPPSSPSPPPMAPLLLLPNKATNNRRAITRVKDGLLLPGVVVTKEDNKGTEVTKPKALTPPLH